MHAVIHTYRLLLYQLYLVLNNVYKKGILVLRRNRMFCLHIIRYKSNETLILELS